MQYIELAKSVLREETLRYVFTGLIIFILYQALIRKYVKSAIKEITTFSSKMDKIDKIDMLDGLKNDLEIIKTTLNDMVYNELCDKVIQAKAIGGKTHQQDEKFKKQWSKYLALGDGNGDGILQDWDSLNWLTDKEYFNKINGVKGNE